MEGVKPLCKSRNGSIHASCRDAIFRERQSHSVSNQEMRAILKAHGGCMVPVRQPVVVQFEASGSGSV